MHWLITAVVFSAADGGVSAPAELWAPRATQILRHDWQDGRSEKRFRVECVPVRFDGDRVTVGDVSFTRRGERVFSPVWRNFWREIPLQGACTTRLDESKLLPSADACRALGRTMVETCENDTCTDSVARFDLGDCEAVVEQLSRTGALLLSAAHADAAKSYQRLTALMAKGGVVWLFEQGHCARATVSAKGEGRVELRGNGWSLTATLEPLFNRGTIEHEEGWATDGGDARWGRGGPSKVTLYLGARLFVLGDRVLSFDEGLCAAR